MTNFFAYAQKLREALAHLGDDEDAPIHRAAIDTLLLMADTDDGIANMRGAVSLHEVSDRFYTHWSDVVDNEPEPDEPDPESIAAREHADAESLSAAGRGHLNVRGW